MRFDERKTAEYQKKQEMSERAKREHWEEIKRRSPDMAESIRRLVNQFGKLKSLRVVWYDD